MIVCSCHAVTDRDLRAAVQDGARTVAEAQLSTRAGMSCGGCRIAVKAVLAEAFDPSATMPLRVYRSDFEARLAAS